MEGYSVKVIETSEELTAKQRIAIKDTSACTKLDTEVTPEAGLLITPVAYAMLQIHNEKSDHKDYCVYIIIDANGTRYVTGSESFWTQFRSIWDEMKEFAPDEEFELNVYKMESKNYKGKHFLTCSIV